jgi:hypothetical protein
MIAIFSESRKSQPLFALVARHKRDDLLWKSPEDRYYHCKIGFDRGCPLLAVAPLDRN